jgi:hypothetical protein
MAEEMQFTVYTVVQLHGMASFLIDLQVHGGLCSASGHGGHQIQVRTKLIKNFLTMTKLIKIFSDDDETNKDLF